MPEDLDAATARKNFVKACDKGLLKTFAKMGISTLQSYRGAQIFEAVGLDRELVARCFTGTPSRVSGVGYDVIAREAALRHERAFPGDGVRATRSSIRAASTSGARAASATRSIPTRVAKLQHAVQRREQLRELQGVRARRRRRRRAPLHAARAVPLQVRPRSRSRSTRSSRPSEIVKRFCTGAMSLRLDLARGAPDARDRDEPARRQEQHRRGRRGSRPLHARCRTAISRRSAIKQVASGRFGVTSWYLVNADELQIKIAQGAKPGEGGELPGPQGRRDDRARRGTRRRASA